jgi:hypothetical protein
VEAEDGKGRRGDDRGERNVTGEEEDDEEDRKGREGGGGGEGEEYSKRAGYTFATTEAEPDGEDMAEDGCYGCGYREVIVVGSDVFGDDDGDIGFSEIEQESSYGEAFGSGARHISGADIAAAGGANILFTKDLYEDIAEGNRTEEIGQRDGDEPRNHCLQDEFIK